MSVSVKLTGQQRRHAPGDEILVPLADAGSVSELLNFLQKTYPDLPLPGNSCMALVNDQASAMDAPLKKNDAVTFMPLFGGG